MLEIDFGDAPREPALGRSTGVIIKARVHKQLIQLHGLLPASLEHCQNFTTAICSAEPCQEFMLVCDISVPHAAGSGLYCDTSIDGIGTCWPRSSAGQMVSRPCPEMFYGVRYNTTSKSLRHGSCQLANNRLKTRFNLSSSLFSIPPLTRLPLGQIWFA